MFGIIYWLLIFHGGKLQKASEYVSEPTLHEAEVSDASEESMPTPWVLASIIWYLSMIREAGVSATQSPGVVQSVAVAQVQQTQTITVRALLLYPKAMHTS